MGAITAHYTCPALYLSAWGQISRFFRALFALAPYALAMERYHALLLRIWRVEGEGQRRWRASIEDAHSGQRRGFSDPAALLAFLEALVEPGPPEPAARPTIAEK
jgi:hypothetical protein